MRRVSVTALLAGAFALASLCLPGIAQALIVPTVTLTSPAQGALIAGGQPQFGGSASNGSASDVTVSVYSGGAVDATRLVQTVTTTPAADNSYSVGPASPLPDGQYTAQAQQSNLIGPGSSTAVTFNVRNGLPQVSLDAPLSGPSPSPTPSLTGTGGTAAGDAQTVTVDVYAGAAPGQTPVRSLTARVNSGSFSVQVAPGLDDGQYTAVASQQGAAGTGTSGPQTFSIKANAPKVSITEPATGSFPRQDQLRFAGAAGDVFGDSAQVVLNLYQGSSTSGTGLGAIAIDRTGPSWSAPWPTTLSPGLYTAQATQADDAGHLGMSAATTFIVSRAPNPIGSTVKLSKAGFVSLSVLCPASPGEQCTGTVLIVTARAFRPKSSGPRGPLRLVFQYVTIGGGDTATIRERVPKATARALRKVHGVKLKVSTVLGSPGVSPASASASRQLRTTHS
jgi:hypothetical protein